MKKCTILAASILFTLGAYSVNGAESWKAPLGIPTPSFGITNSHWMYTNSNYTWDYGSGPVPYRRNEHGPYVYYIDNSHPASTDTGNTWGTPEKPRRTWPYPVAGGAVLQVHGGPYSFVNSEGSKMAIGGSGSPDKPIFFYGTTTNRDSMATIAATECYTYGNWLVVERIKFVGCAVSTRPGLKGAPVISSALRDCYLFGNGASRNAISTGGSTGNSAENYTMNWVILRNEVHGYGDWLSTTENDTVGVMASENATNIWVLDNNIYNMSGDSARIGADQGATPSGGNYYLGRNWFHDNRENAVDVKQARNSVISENIMHGFGDSSSSSGTAVAMHYLPRNIWVINNVIYDSLRGIVSTGVGTDAYVIGNVVYDCAEYGMYLTRGGGTFHVANNTVSSCGNGIITSGTIDAMHYRNNIVTDITSSSGYHLQISDSVIAGKSSAQNFMFNQSSGSVRIYWAGELYGSAAEWVADSGKGAGSVVANPIFVNASGRNYKLASGSPAIDRGVSIANYDEVFRASFGVSLLRDYEGDARPSGNGWDVGADEFNAGSNGPNAPQGLRIIN